MLLAVEIAGQPALLPCHALDRSVGHLLEPRLQDRVEVLDVRAVVEAKARKVGR